MTITKYFEIDLCDGTIYNYKECMIYYVNCDGINYTESVEKIYDKPSDAKTYYRELSDDEKNIYCSASKKLVPMNI